MSQNFNKLRELLKQLFQLDRADLDFGIYRIINKQREKITRFLDKDLLPQVKDAFKKYQSTNRQVLQQELEQAIETAKSLGVNPDDTPKVKELKERIANVVDIIALEEEVYSHLYNFFRRYYSEGDFLSLRRYKEGVYAIPYEGEEVKLHWANADQYYIKSSENLRNYAFKLPSGKRVKFELVAATLEKDNNKAANGKERKFYLCENEPAILEGNDLIFRFEYQVNPEKQEVLNAAACERFFSLKGLEIWQSELSQKQPTEKNLERTLLEKHITDFTAKNTFDYFIHKDLGGFLRRELDFYIKTEVMHLDDIENETALRVERYLDQIKALRHVAHKIITFVEQIENFQKKLWLKKKFVVETNYCITLDRVPEELYAEILENTAQIEEWKQLFAIDEIKGDLLTPKYSEPLTVEFLKTNPYLVIDTCLFSQIFKNNLLNNLYNLDQSIIGLLIYSENFQALNLISSAYKGRIFCSFIDPPYNTDEDGFPYKDKYQHSSWLSMIYDRLILGRVFLSQEGSLWCTISDDEFKNLLFIIESIYGKSNFIANIVWQKRTSPDARLTLGAAHDYVIVFANEIYSFKKHKRLLPLTEGRVNDYKNPDNDPRGVWASVDLTGQVGHATESQFYEIVTPGSKKYTPPKGRCWAVSEKTFHSLVEEGRIWFGQNGLGRPRLKRYLSEAEGISAWTWWGNQEVGHNQEAKKECNDLLNIGDNFETSKPIKLLQRILQLGTISTSDIVIDYFAGSGTTGHAVINLNREDAGNRKYILVEMGEHFDTVLKPRIQKVIYSKDWKDGKPVSREGISHCFKYIRLESYEDALNNIEITNLNKPQQLTLDQYQNFRESYMLSYILEMETKGSASLLNVEAFDKPFDYKLKIWQNDEFQEIAVDLVETFNYLLGLNVQRIQTLDNVRIVKGINRENQKVLIIWRNLNELDNDTLEEWFIKHFLEHEFDLIYVNCDNNLANIRPANATWQVLLTEAEFKRLMFDIQDI